MAKAIVLCKEIQNGASKGAPDIGTSYRGFVYVGNLPGAYAVYIITGSGAQLTAIQTHANCVGGALVTESGGVKWGKMNEPISQALLDKINTWRAARKLATVDASTTLKQVAKWAASHFDGQGNFDVFDQ